MNRFAELCLNCGEMRGKDAAVSPLQDEHWCPKSGDEKGFMEDRDNIGPNTFHGSGRHGDN